MPEYHFQNSDLADAILEDLYGCRPNRVLFDDLKKRLPEFINAPEEEWIDALKGLSEAGLADVAPIASGFQGEWRAVINAGISSRGEQEVAELRAVETYSDLRFQDWSEQLYANLDRTGANLGEEFAHKGLLASSSYYRAAVRLILDRLGTFEDAVVTTYLRVVQERTAEGVTGIRERWLRKRILATWKTEVERAERNASHLCEISGVSPDQYAPQMKELEVEADGLKRRLIRKLEAAMIEQRLPVAKPRSPGAPETDAPTVPQDMGRRPSESRPDFDAPTKIFCAYSHEDEKLRDKLATHLSPLEREGLIELWFDRKIGAGKEWEKEIGVSLEGAGLILLLVSPDFIASDYCYGREIKRALERHLAGTARVIPVILRPVDWQKTSIGKLQALPKDGKPVTQWANEDEALLNVAKGVREAVSEIAQPATKRTEAITLHVRSVAFTTDYNGVIVVADVRNPTAIDDQITDWWLDIPALGLKLDGRRGPGRLRPSEPWFASPPLSLPANRLVRGAVFFPGNPAWRRQFPGEPIRATLTLQSFRSGELAQELEIYTLRTLSERENRQAMPPTPSSEVLTHDSTQDAAGDNLVSRFRPRLASLFSLCVEVAKEEKASFEQQSSIQNPFSAQMSDGSRREPLPRLTMQKGDIRVSIAPTEISQDVTTGKHSAEVSVGRVLVGRGRLDSPSCWVDLSEAEDRTWYVGARWERSTPVDREVIRQWLYHSGPPPIW
jgi:hypothetical protein